MQPTNDPRYPGYVNQTPDGYSNDARYPGWQPETSQWQQVPWPAPSGYPSNDAYPQHEIWQGYAPPTAPAPYAPPSAYPLGLQPPAYPPYANAPAPYAQPPAPYAPQSQALQPYQSAPTAAPAPQFNPLQAPLAAGILGHSDATRLTNNAANLAMDLAGTLFATNLAGKTKGVNLAGGGFAIGGSFVPTAACHIDVLGPSDANDGKWFVRSHQAVGAAATLAVGGGIAVVGGGAMVGAAWENAWTYVALVPEDVARALVPSTEHGTLVSILSQATGERLIRWPDFSHIDNLGIGEATRTSRMCRGTVGIVVSSMLQNGIGYMTLTGTFERTVWRSDARYLEISDGVTHVTECGISAGFSVLEKVDLSHDRTKATRITLKFDLDHPQARAMAERIVRDHSSLPFSMAPKGQGTWSERFFHDLPAGVTAVKLETVEQTHSHAGGGLLDSVAKYLKASGLGLSFDMMHDHRREIDASGVLNSDTTAHLKQVGVLWLGTSSQLIFVNAQYGTLHGQSQPVFLGLVLGMQYEITKVRGTNRNGFLEDFNKAFGFDIPEFEEIASHSGYYVAVRRLLSAADLERLTHLDQNTLAQANIIEPKRVKKLLQLRDLLQSAHQQSAEGPRQQQAIGGFQPLLLTETAETGTQAYAAADPSAEDVDADSVAIARSRVMQNEITGVKTLGALCQWLGGDAQAMQVCVRHGACEKPLERMRNFNLEYNGQYAQVRACDSVAQVKRRFEQADKLRSQLDRGLEALHKDVLGNSLAAQANEAAGDKLVEAYVALDRAISLEHLTPRQKLALIRQDDIFNLLPAVQQAHALCLYDRHGCHTVDEDDRTQVRRALDREYKRITQLSVPDAHQRLRDAQIEILRDASDTLAASTTDLNARTWGQPWGIELPDDRFFAASAAQARGDALFKLPAYDIHFLVQDNDAMAPLQDDVRGAIAAFVDVVRPYDPQGVIDVTFLTEALAHMPARPLQRADDAYALQWGTCGTHAMVGNALEGALQDFIVGARQRPTHKYAAYIVLTTGGMSDPKVVVDALTRVQEAIPNFEDEVCVGFLQLKNTRRDGTSVFAGLDTHSKVGSMIESDTQVGLPIANRVYPLLSGMLNKEQDAANNSQNKANAVKDTLHRLTHWNWKSDKTA